MSTGPTHVREQAMAMVLAWRQGVDAAAREQTDQLTALVGEPPDDSNWLTDYVDGVQERWPAFVDHVGRTAGHVGEAVGDYLDGVQERWPRFLDHLGRTALLVEPER